MSDSAANNNNENTSSPQENEYPSGENLNNHQQYGNGMMGGMGYGGVTISSSISTVSAYVGNLHPSTTKEDLQNLFEECGSIRRIAVPVHPTGQIKGCGYVEFDEPESLQKALELHNTKLKGHTIDVFAKRDTVRDMRGMMCGRGRGYPMMNPYGRGGYAMMNPYGRGMMMPYGGYPGYAAPYMNGRGMGAPPGYPMYPLPPYGRGGAPARGYGAPYGHEQPMDPESTPDNDNKENTEDKKAANPGTK